MFPFVHVITDIRCALFVWECKTVFLKNKFFSSNIADKPLQNLQRLEIKNAKLSEKGGCPGWVLLK